MRERFRGCLLGLAAGDAVGTTVEFSTPGTFKPVTDMVGGGPFRLKAGEWTDDMSMAMCLAASLIEKQGFDPHDQMERYVRWRDDGYMSSNGHCFDIGVTVNQALARFAQSGDPFSGNTDTFSAGNGSIMRLAPVPMFYANNPRLAIKQAGESSRTTHATPAAVDACRYLAGLIVGALHGASKDELLAACYTPVPDLWKYENLMPDIDQIAAGSFKHRNPPEIVGTGYVVRSLEAALWAFDRSSSFEEGCLLAVNLGNDADTTAAVYGQLAGAFYGEAGIPERWRTKLAMHDTIVQFADQLYDLSQQSAKP